MSENDEFEWMPGPEWWVKEPDEEDRVVFATLYCAELTLKAMRSRSRAASEGYQTAARFFAMTVEAAK